MTAISHNDGEFFTEEAGYWR